MERLKVKGSKIKRREIRGTETAEWYGGVQGGNVGRSVRARSGSVRLGVRRWGGRVEAWIRGRKRRRAKLVSGV